MKALRVELYQDHVCWRQESGYRFFQTYPLPTPSMVRGLVHRLLGIKWGSNEYIPLKIGIQGQYDSIFVDMQRWDALTKKRAGVNVKNDNDHTLMFWEELANVHLLLHIAFKNDSDADLERLRDAFISNTVVLGRNEDIARIDSCEIVELTPTDEDVNPKYPVYVSKSGSESSYPVFRLPFAYRINGTQRIFEYVDVNLMTKNAPVDTEWCYIYDGKAEAVCFLELSDEQERNISEK